MIPGNRYDHRNHAGNAGDVWKHFLLTETAERLLSERTDLVYAESHAGRPEYSLEGEGEWRGGIGRCWERLPFLLDYRYFRILAEMNPYGLTRYPGSAQLVLRVASSLARDLRAEVWDDDPAVAPPWQGQTGVRLHIGDGFSGVTSLLAESPPGLLLIDPPYTHPDEGKLARELFFRAEKAGWIALCWRTLGDEHHPEDRSQRFDLQFSEAEMDGGRGMGAAISIVGADDGLLRNLRKRADGFLDVLKIA